MAYNFKSIADVEVVAEPTESANVLIEEDGVIKKAPKTAVGGAGGANIITYISKDHALYKDGKVVDYNDILADWESGAVLRIKFEDTYEPDDILYATIIGFGARHTDDGSWKEVYFAGGNAGSWINSFVYE